MSGNSAQRHLRLVPQTAKPTVARLRYQGVDDFAWQEAVKAFVAWLIKELAVKFTFLSWPFVGWIVSYFLTPILIDLIGKLLLWFQFNIIDRVTEKQKEEYEKAKEELRKIHDKEDATDAEVEKATQDFKDKFRDLIHIDAA